MKRYLSIWVIFVLSIGTSVFAGGHVVADFVHRSGNRLTSNGIDFYAIGVNSYFLQEIAARGDTAHVIEIFREAQLLGVTTIRTWGFSDCSDSTLISDIQWGPGQFNERGLLALDYVIAKAREYSIRLIIPLVNNWDAYGGMNQYVEWLAALRPGVMGKQSAVPQRIVSGAGDRTYRLHVAGGFKHDDFYSDSTIKQWYKNYLSMLVNRTNRITHLQYKDDPAIAVWELANEPRSSDPTGQIVTSWMNQMSSYLKTLDMNHLVSTGEEGLDVSNAGYASPDFYSNQAWLFDGSGGVSFSRDAALPNIDIASIHCYPSDWRFAADDASLWLRDHQRIATRYGKPLILGEVGFKDNVALYADALFNEAYLENASGMLLWQLVYDGRPNNDGYAFSYPTDGTLCNTIQKYAERFGSKGTAPGANTLAVSLLPNYPNPVHGLTEISYTLPQVSVVRLEVFNDIGQRVALLSDDEQSQGMHIAFFDGSLLSNGVYFYRLSVTNLAGKFSQVRKLILAR